MIALSAGLRASARSIAARSSSSALTSPDRTSFAIASASSRSYSGRNIWEDSWVGKPVGSSGDAPDGDRDRRRAAPNVRARIKVENACSLGLNSVRIIE